MASTPPCSPPRPWATDCPCSVIRRLFEESALQPRSALHSWLDLPRAGDPFAGIAETAPRVVWAPSDDGCPMNEPSATEPAAPRRSGRRRLVLPALVAAAAVGLLALLAFGVSKQIDSSSLDAQVAAGRTPTVPDTAVALPMLGSSMTRDLDDYRGKIVVLNFFASWCTGCRAEAALMVKEQRVLARHDATIIVGVTYEDDTGATSSFDRQYGVRYPVLRNPNGNLARALGVFYVPETFILDRQGRIVAVNRYQITGSWLRGHLASLLHART